MSKHDDAPLYAVAAEEMANGTFDRGIFAKAYSIALGDETKAKAIYLSLRVEHLSEEIRKNLAELKKREKEERAKPKHPVDPVQKERESISTEFRFLREHRIPDTSDIPSVNYIGSPSGLIAPISASSIADALKILEFKVIDAIKAGILTGVRDQDGDWWVERHKK